MKFRIVSLILLLPILNSIDISFGFLFQDTVNTFGYLKAIYIIVLFVISANLLRVDKFNKYVYVLIAYFLIISLLSSNISHSIIELSKIVVSLFVYLIAYNLIDNDYDLKRLFVVYIWSSLIVILSYTAAQYFNIGAALYSDEQIFLPGGRIHGSMILTYGSMVLIFLIATNKRLDYWQFIKILILIVSIILVLLTFRRASIIALIIGVILYGIYSQNSRNLFKYSSLIIILLIVLAPFYAENVINLYYERDAIDTLTDSEFGRTRDLKFAINDIIESGFIHILFGIEFLNFANYMGVRRGIHGDFAVLIHGAGFVGMFLYLLTLLKMFKIKLVDFKRNNHGELNALKYAIIAAFFIISLSNQLLYVSVLSHALLLIGAINGVIKTESKKN